MTFTTFVMFDMFNALCCRSADKIVPQMDMFANKAFLYSVGGSLVGQVCALGRSEPVAVLCMFFCGWGRETDAARITYGNAVQQRCNPLAADVRLPARTSCGLLHHHLVSPLALNDVRQS